VVLKYPFIYFFIPLSRVTFDANKKRTPLNHIKKLAGQTAIYGLSSILGRFLFYLLVPLHTAMFVTSQYGVITEMYSYVSFLVVLLLYGMETAYFRFSTNEQADRQRVYSTVMLALSVTSTLFVALAWGFAQPVANFLKYPSNPEYIIWFAFILGLDALTAIPMARLRADNRAVKFAVVNLAAILITILLNLFFVGYCMALHQKGQTNWLIDLCYNPAMGVGYVFIANLAGSAVKFVLLLPDMLKARGVVDVPLLRRMLRYALPLLVFGLAGIVNETIDRIMLKWMLYHRIGAEATMSQIGIYGACYKVSIIITLFIQAFRYAAEPFFFAHQKEKGSLEVYARVMTYFVIVCTTIFTGVLLYLDVVKYFIDPAYWEGLGVVPILMCANICLGIYYNQSVWYKLSGQTQWGAYLGLGGAILTIGLNYWWIPLFGYIGSAWATLACYAAMMMASYFLGQKYFPIPYHLRRIATYTGAALLVYGVSVWMPTSGVLLKYGVNTLLFLSFLALVFALERRSLGRG